MKGGRAVRTVAIVAILAATATTASGIDDRAVVAAAGAMGTSIATTLWDSRAALHHAHLTENLPWGAQIEFGDVELGKPFASDTNGWAFQLAKTALSDAFGVESVEIGIGGSIPFIADLTEVFPEAQILVTGVEEPDGRAHSPNESVHLETLRGAMIAEALMLVRANEQTV